MVTAWVQPYTAPFPHDAFLCGVCIIVFCINNSIVELNFASSTIITQYLQYFSGISMLSHSIRTACGFRGKRVGRLNLNLNLSVTQVARAKSVLIYKSNSNNPFFNIAFENFLLTKDRSDEDHILYLWRNGPSVIIGRFQSAWKECEVTRMEENNVNLVRRSSGGGAVYQVSEHMHELGSTGWRRRDAR